MNQQVIELTKELISFASITPDDAGAIDYIAELLAGEGFDTTEKTFGDWNYSVNNLYACKGNGGNFCFAGHIDVVPPGDKSLWENPPFSPEIRGNHLTGRGATDMKGALAASLVAGSKFMRDYPDAGKVSYLITADEEGEAKYGTSKMLDHLEATGETLDFCLIGEPTYFHKFGDTIKIGSRASANFKLEVFGRRGHVAYPEDTINPTVILARVIHNLSNIDLDEDKQEDSYFEASNLEITGIESDNQATNVVPGMAAAYFNIRYNPKMSIEDIKQKLHNAIGRDSQNYELSVIEDNPAYFSQPGQFAEEFRQLASEQTNGAASFSTRGGSSDGKFISAYSSVIEFGLKTSEAHKINEFLDIRDLQKLTDMYYKGLQRYFQVE
jgi:succinyl-diaminopimelate desuccinylase